MTPYERDGYVVVRGLFDNDEVAAMRDHFTQVVERGGDGWCEAEVDPTSDDPLRRYPRLLQPHRGDAVAREYLLSPRVREQLEAVLGETPLAVQTMVYFKPPGARGQALHQDQRYLRVQPGTCTAAWLALDDTDEGNGCLEVVPGSHRLPVLCPGRSDLSRSFTSDEVPLPEGAVPVPVPMRAGDVLLFTGNLIHGSGPNTSTDRFRRIVVGHYIAADAEQVAHFYHPVLSFDDRQVEGLESVQWGTGPCGVFEDGQVRMTDGLAPATAAH